MTCYQVERKGTKNNNYNIHIDFNFEKVFGYLIFILWGIFKNFWLKYLQYTKLCFLLVICRRFVRYVDEKRGS
jgi:hypothetical protein